MSKIHRISGVTLFMQGYNLSSLQNVRKSPSSDTTVYDDDISNHFYQFDLQVKAITTIFNFQNIPNLWFTNIFYRLQNILKSKREMIKIV